MPHAQGLALQCRPDGTIVEVLWSDLPLRLPPAPGLSCLLLADAASLPAMARFLEEVRSAGAAFQREIGATMSGGVRALHLSGFRLGAALIVVATLPAPRATEMGEDLVWLSDRENLARRAAFEARRAFERRDRMFDELGRINNELAEAQRELAKKNALLEQKEREITRMLLTDHLTGLPNRRDFDQLLHAETERLARHGDEFCLALGDIDHFKAVNDTFGHDAGDQVLATIAAILRQALRATDTVARWGGEEFAFLLPRTTLHEAELVLDRVRAKVAATPPVAIGHPVTISLGVAAVRTAATAEAALQRADVALYAAKRSGRNRVTVASAEAAAASHRPGAADPAIDHRPALQARARLGRQGVR